MKLFKKLAAVCMAGVMALSLVACGGATVETGYYKLSSMKQGDQEFTEEQLSAIGTDTNYMVIEEGGKGFMNMMGVESELTWDDKNITSEGSPAGYTFSDGTLTVSQEDTTMVFKKSTDPAPARGGAAAEDTTDDAAEETTDDAAAEETTDDAAAEETTEETAE